MQSFQFSNAKNVAEAKAAATGVWVAARRCKPKLMDTRPTIAMVMPSMIWWQARRMLAVAYAWWLMAGYGVLAVGAVVLAVWLGADWGVRLGVVIGYGVVVGLYEYRLLRRAPSP
jgi:hypothetical protein